MILSFNPQFVPKILAGTKKQTIREDKTNRWKVGNAIHFATGVRTKNYKQFAFGTVEKIIPIMIQYARIYKHTDLSNCCIVKVSNTHYASVALYVDGIWKDLAYKQLNQLAIDDGFDTIENFFNWFDKDFDGKIITWNEFKPLNP